MTLTPHTYSSLKKGPVFTILGAVHGNERCGPEAVNRIISALNNKEITLQKGTLICLPVSNPKAYEQNMRFVESNLNRYLFPKKNCKTYEDEIGNQLCEILAKTDVLLDLHSYQSKGDAFIFLGPINKKEYDYAKSLGVSQFVYGWQDAFGDTKSKKAEQESMGTTEFTRSKGGIAVTLECGHHFNSNNADIGYQAIINALSHLGMIKQQRNTKAKINNVCVKMKTRIVKTENGHFPKPWKNFDAVKKGETLAILNNGKTITAKEDSYIVLPHEENVIGASWMYLGEKTEFPT